MRFLLLVQRRCWRRAAAALLVPAILGLSVIAHADEPAPPFQVVWTRGVCTNCQTAQGFGGIAHAAGKNIWALGYGAPGEAGSGAWTVLHSRDGGRRWRELGWTYVYQSTPMASFANAREGWIALPRQGEGFNELLLKFTRNGSTWQRLWQRENFFGAIQYFGDGFGFAANAKRLYQTSDHGRHWRWRRLPGGGLGVAQMRFANRRQGYLTGCHDRRLVVLATPDAGRSWFRTELPAPPGNDAYGTCSLELDGLTTVGNHEAWLLGVKHDFNLGDTQGDARVWRTADGGRTWSETYRGSWTEAFGDPVPGQTGTYLDAPAVAFSGPVALGTKVILIFKDTNDGKGEALYTIDQGQHWSAAPLPHFITGCTATRSALACVGDTYPGFWFARITLRDEFQTGLRKHAPGFPRSTPNAKHAT